MKPKKAAEKSQPLLRDYVAVDQMVKLVLAARYEQIRAANQSTPRPAATQRRETQIFQRFLETVHWDKLDEDIEGLQELQLILNRRSSSDENTSEILDRVIELLEDLADTGESCRLKSNNNE